jgi:dsDNA-specific endonuclease/ATPase MutS2
MAKLKLDLHDIYNKGGLIEKELNRIIDEAIEKKIKEVEIIPGKGSGQLKKKVLRFLDQKHIKKKYHRIDKDSKNFGRLFVYFKFK